MFDVLTLKSKANRRKEFFVFRLKVKDTVEPPLTATSLKGRSSVYLFLFWPLYNGHFVTNRPQ